MEENNSVAPDTRSEEELDTLVDGGEKATNRERPMADEPKKEAAPTKEEYEFVHNGKPIKGTRDQIIKWAQMGYDRPQFAQKFNQEKQKWEQDRQNWEKQWGVYRQIDDYAKQNKDWFDHWQQAWQNKGQIQQPGAQSPQTGAIPAEIQPYLSKIQSLEQKLSQFEPVVNQILERDQVAKQKEEDTKLDQEVQSIRKQYQDLDWDNLDENGRSLEMRVLEHAQTNGISKFGAAFKDLLHDDLISRAQAQAKQAVAKGIQNRTKLGVLGESPTSQKGMPERNRNIRDTTYEELEQEIREEIKRGRAS